MSKRPISIVLRVLGVLLVLGVVAGGAFRFGYGQGVAESPAIAEQIQAWQKSGTAPAPFYGPGFRGMMMHGGFSPFMHRGPSFFGGFLGFLFLAFLFFGLMRMFFFRPWMHHQGPWHGHMPPWAQQPPTPPAPSQPETPQGENK